MIVEFQGQEAHPDGTLYVFCPSSYVPVVETFLEAVFPGEPYSTHEADYYTNFALDRARPSDPCVFALHQLGVQTGDQIRWEWHTWNKEHPYNYGPLFQHSRL